MQDIIRMMNNEMSLDVNELNDNPYYLETTAFYMFHKIFCATNYGLGEKILIFL